MTLARPDIATGRLLLRRTEMRDVDAVMAVVGDWEIARRLSRVPQPHGPADAAFFIEQVVPGEWVWAITVHGSAELVGAVGLTPEETGETCEL